MPKALKFKLSTLHKKHGNHSQIVNKFNGDFQDIAIDSTLPNKNMNAPKYVNRMICIQKYKRAKAVNMNMQVTYKHKS